jgi:hypothetical protein
LEDVAAFEFVAEFLHAGEDEAVFGGEELLALAEGEVAGEGVALVGVGGNHSGDGAGCCSSQVCAVIEGTELCE